MRFRFANAVTLVLYLALFILFFIGSYAIPMQTQEQLESGAALFSNITRFYPPAQFYTDALVLGEAPSWFYLAVASVILPALAVTAFAKAFHKINAALSEHRTRSDFKLETVSVSGVFAALVKKEAKLFFSSTMYVMNTAIGMVMFTIFVAATAVMGYDTIAMFLEIPGGGDLMISVSAAVAMFCVGMCLVTAPSISMEGSSLWIIKTLPVRFWDIAKAKIGLNLIITVPLTVINTAVLAVIIDAGWALYIGLTLALVCFCVFSAVMGLIVNLYFPKLEWKNPTQAVKQSASVVIAMLINMGVTILCGVGYYFTSIALDAYAYITAGALAAAAWVLVVFLRTKGQGLFNDL
jgi:ABC-2 type transport system permease protein